MDQANSKTSTDTKVPTRFEQPELWKYSDRPVQHPLYRTTGSMYGSVQPTKFEMPTQFHTTSHRFTDRLGPATGMRRGSLNH